MFWYGYVPIHELIHAGACLLCGGAVEELAIDSRYGGAWLAKIFPFVVADSDYAGQLTRFSVPNGVAFAFVDLAPYALSLFGVTLLEVSRRHGSAALFSMGFLLAFAPVISVTGDYYEAASQLTSHVATSLDSDLPCGVLVSDDVFRLMNDLRESGTTGPTTVIFLVLGLLASVDLVLVTFALQVIIADRLVAETDKPQIKRIPKINLV